MKKVEWKALQDELNRYQHKSVFIHLETTNGAYASHFQEGFFNSGAFIRNVELTYNLGKVTPDYPHRVGLKTTNGWVYAQGITHYEVDEQNRLLMAGLDHEGKLAVALQISETAFPV